MSQAGTIDSNDTIKQSVTELAKATKSAALSLSLASDDIVNHALDLIADKLRAHAGELIKANTLDIEKGRKNGLSDALIDRLLLNEDRLDGIADAVLAVKELPSPVGRLLWEENRPTGLHIKRVSVPIGVLGIIYESRPNVTIDAAALCIKSRNAAVLRGGSESFHSSRALHGIIQLALAEAGLQADCISMVDTTDRAAVDAMLACDRYIDVIVPRGGKGLVDKVMRDAVMPVFGHREGLCHVYIHKNADKDMAVNVTVNSKLRRTGICGAAETLLLDDQLDDDTTKLVLNALIDQGCEIVGDDALQALDNRIKAAQDSDWSTEYLASKISARRVKNIDDAIDHINSYGSHHTECIITKDSSAALRFQQEVDSGIVVHNASTQFADGGEFGMGAEIGISTGKMHARGPVGLEQLCTYKYHVNGSGQTRP